jgi:hypothetical protein
VTAADGAGTVPAGEGSSPSLSGGSGVTPGRHYDRSATLSLDWDRERRVTPVANASQEVRLELSGGVGSRPQAPWWNADRRRADDSARAVLADDLRRLRRLVCDERGTVGIRVCRRSASFICRRRILEDS